MREFDAIIIGSGQAAPSLAVRLAKSGRRTALVERRALGGTCVNTGCTPTKTMVASARAAHLARRAAEYGVVLPPGEVKVDLARVKARKDAVVAESREGLTAWLRGTEGVTVIEGHARLTGPHGVEVNGEALTAPWIMLNVGARPTLPPVPGLETVPHLTSTSIQELETLPDHLLVLGGSYIGLEFAQMFRRFGARVTVLETAPHLLPREDADIAAAVAEFLRAEGVEILTGVTGLSLAPAPEGVRLAHQGGALLGSHLLVATGRTPNTDDLGLEAAGVARDARGYVTVDDGLRTNIPGIWALGDCNGRGAFTHTSWDDYEILAANLLDGAQRSLADRVMGYALFTDPPLGRAGMTEAAARAAGHRIRVGMRPMRRVARAREKGETAGLMKIVIDDMNDAILGAAILGPGGDEAIHTVLALMNARAPARVLREMMPIHPTVAELLPTLVAELGPAEPDPVDETVEESFPASDPPSHTPESRIGRPGN
ncbi:FAD-containing oxidoreductase [Siccirubricoccus sp. KC 17139]|uniref:FAD-containing oxidoreductase n=1 Tax=Siccirubricoccus soli TaxID=2899147 RepID=A0ABT1DCB2_9PROT|nr:FAD-containing oxidoreductase [Siccirubricoccus soli]MCO6419583.1 FAD-containing oxidoreductase [Siccirubricoccus soli]MCP2685718.1 FAD-containing oxidoreductase [Siccirubricoccus soli]